MKVRPDRISPSQSEDAKAAAKRHLKVIRRYVALADPMSLGCFPEDEYSSVEVKVFKLLTVGADAEQIAQALSFGTQATAKAREVAMELRRWWEEAGSKR